MTEDLSTKRDIKQIEFIIKYCSNIKDAIQIFGQDEEDFLSNIQFQHSCAFAVEQIGERVKRLSGDLVSKHSEVEWKEIAGFRNVLSHDYPNVNLSVFWSTIINDVPRLKKECERILEELKQSSVF